MCLIVVFSVSDETSTSHAAVSNVTVCQSVDGQTYVDGQLWQLDACTRCLCHAGTVLCHSAPCPPAPCDLPQRQPGACCATCADAASAAGRQAAACRDAAGGFWADEEVWRQDACVSCQCRGGEVSCFHERCPQLDCPRPVLKKGHCCPVCLGEH